MIIFFPALSQDKPFSQKVGMKSQNRPEAMPPDDNAPQKRRSPDAFNLRSRPTGRRHLAFHYHLILLANRYINFLLIILVLDQPPWNRSVNETLLTGGIHDSSHKKDGIGSLLTDYQCKWAVTDVLRYHRYRGQTNTNRSNGSRLSTGFVDA